ncbi:carboxysome shell protein [Caldalkalibacillus thermarum]|uniref:BMC domain-containing protein n=1 Tax=Caldalkalibacillus thermarum TaxID=296745 RepID=UPI00166325F4|nr:BMC domain-containing protein [Caldalkalibacillus thermarum]GGK30353.1 carboxysome shell protein [Caldalkalibacillus thermarum]
MRKYEALGVIETQYFTCAVELLDHMCKTANVDFLASERYLGGGLVTVIVGGGIADVTRAVEAAQQLGQRLGNALKMALVITNPHPEILKFIPPAQQEQVKGQLSTAIESQAKQVKED